MCHLPRSNAPSLNFLIINDYLSGFKVLSLCIFLYNDFVAIKILRFGHKFVIGRKHAEMYVINVTTWYLVIKVLRARIHEHAIY